jgi:large subunit ribosomal protein L17
MKHRYAGSRLGRNSSWRKATVRDVAKATLISQRICTTKAKAQEARKLVEKLITMGKKGTLSHKRQAFAILCDHQLVSELFARTAPRFKNRVGGYTRIIPLGHRRGDAAQMVLLELTEKDQVIVSKPKVAAVSQPKVVDVTPESQEVKSAEETKKKSPKPEQSKTPFKKGVPVAEKTASEKKPLGALKRIFKSKRAD